MESGSYRFEILVEAYKDRIVFRAGEGNKLVHGVRRNRIPLKNDLVASL
jgi:hypothetical protein